MGASVGVNRVINRENLHAGVPQEVRETLSSQMNKPMDPLEAAVKSCSDIDGHFRRVKLSQTETRMLKRAEA